MRTTQRPGLRPGLRPELKTGLVQALAILLLYSASISTVHADEPGSVDVSTDQSLLTINQGPLIIEVETETEAKELADTIENIAESIKEAEVAAKDTTGNPEASVSSPSWTEKVRLLIQDHSRTVFYSILISPIVAYTIYDPMTAIKFAPCVAALCYVAITCPGGHAICPCSDRWTWAAGFCAGMNPQLVQSIKLKLAALRGQ